PEVVEVVGGLMLQRRDLSAHLAELLRESGRWRDNQVDRPAELPESVLGIVDVAVDVGVLGACNDRPSSGRVEPVPWGRCVNLYRTVHTALTAWCNPLGTRACGVGRDFHERVGPGSVNRGSRVASGLVRRFRSWSPAGHVRQSRRISL